MKAILIIIVLSLIFSIVSIGQECKEIKRENTQLKNVIESYKVLNKEIKNQSAVFESELELVNEPVQTKNKDILNYKNELENKEADLKKQKTVTRIFGGSTGFLVVVLIIILI